MDLLKEWLGSTVARELSGAVQWRERTPTDIRLSDNGQYEDDGSNLRAKSSKPGVVQIMKLVTNEEPIEAWISDSTARLKATMATSAVQKFFTESRKRVNKGILGGLIQILDFEVVATHLGPRDSRLTLLIKEFKSLGSEGSSIFGGIPRPIELTNLEIQELSERLKGIRAKENRHNKPLDDSERDSTVTSHNDFDLSSDDSPMASQQALATQAQRTNHPIERIEKERGSPTRQDSVPFPAPVAGVKSSSPVQKQPNTPLDTRTGNSDIVINENATSGLQVVRHPLEKSSVAAANEVKKPNNVAGLLSLLPTLLPKGNLIKSIAHPKLGNENVVTAEKGIPETESRKDRRDVAEPPKMVGQSNGSSIAVKPGALVEETESLPQAERNSSTLANDSHNSFGTIDGSKESATIEKADSALAQVPNRIREREVRISKEQQNLLDQSDSWIPAEPGKNAPIANVPIETLQAMDRVAESRAVRLSKQTQRIEEERNTIQSSHSSVISESGNGSKSESDPGTSVSWSPSPNTREQLPPNSSPVQLDEFQEETEEEAFHLEKRSMSVSSNSVASVRRNPVRARKKPKLHDKATSTPVSVSHARESRPFSCPIKGCQKSYKLLYHLKYHTEKHHGGAGSAQKVSRVDTVDSEIPPKATLNWFACSKCHKRFGTPVDVLQHEKKSQCSLEPQGKLATTSAADAVMKTADHSSADLNSQLTSSTRNDQGLPKFGHRQQKVDINFTPPTAEHQIPDSPGVQLSESKLLGDTLQGNPTTKSTIPNDVQTNSIRSIHSNETALTIGRHSTAVAETESSDLESNSQASNPHTLYKSKRLDSANALRQRFPSTASQPEEPILQVKRTPYVNNHKYNVGSQTFRPPGSPSSTKPPSLTSTVYDRNTTGIASREHFVIDNSSAETQSNKPTEDSSIGSDGGHTGRQLSPEYLDEESIAQQVQHEIDSQAQRSLNKNFSVLEDNFIGIEHANLQGAKNLENPDLVAPESVSPTAMDRDGKQMKRKSSEAQLLSPNVTKRQRNSKSPQPPRFTQGEQVMPDPSISGRLWRQEHFASRKDFVPFPKEEEDQMHLSPKDRILSPSSQSQDKPSRIIGQAENVGIKGDFEDSAMDLSYRSPSTKALRSSEMNRSVASVESHRLNSIPTTVTSHERFHPRQTRLPAADGEQSDVVMLDADIPDTREAREEQPQTTAPTVGTGGIQTSPRPTIFDRFKISYPDYSGNMAQFVNICNKIRNLVEIGREEHQTLWDDFIVRYCTEYPRYINQCVNMAEDPVPYEQFYRNEVIEARYNKLVVTRKTLNDALILKNHVLRSPGPQQPKITTEDVDIPASLGTKKPPESFKSSFRVSRQRTPLTVDLTDESEDSSILQGPYSLPGSEMKPPNRLPWIGSDRPSGTSYRTDIPARTFFPSNVVLSGDHSKPHSPLGRPSRLNSVSSWDSLNSNPTKITPTR